MRKMNIGSSGTVSRGELLLVVILSLAFSFPESKWSFLLLSVIILLALCKWVTGFAPLRNFPQLQTVREILDTVGIPEQTEEGEKLSGFLRWNMGSRAAIHLYTVILVTYGLTESRFFSTNFTTYVNGASAICAVYLFGKRTVKCSFMAMCVAWFVGLFAAVFFPRTDNFWINMELHDMSFAAGYVLLYYLCAFRKWDVKNLLCLGITVLIILFAFKRIGIVALVLTAGVWLLLRLIKPEKIRRQILLWGSICAIVLCYLFVLVIIEGWLAAAMEAAGIDPSGRNYYYAALAEYCEFTPGFIGLGRNASATLFAVDLRKLRVGNVHSDILRMYAECGFVLFGLWLTTYWIALPHAIDKRFGYRAMEFFLLCNIYTFVVYATDNTELYLINQYFYMLIPIIVSLYPPQISDGNKEDIGRIMKRFTKKVNARDEE